MNHSILMLCFFLIVFAGDPSNCTKGSERFRQDPFAEAKDEIVEALGSSFSSLHGYEVSGKLSLIHI